MAAENTLLDEIDRRIIDILQTDGRISWKDLADRVHLAPSSVADRVLLAIRLLDLDIETRLHHIIRIHEAHDIGGQVGCRTIAILRGIFLF